MLWYLNTKNYCFNNRTKHTLDFYLHIHPMSIWNLSIVKIRVG